MHERGRATRRSLLQWLSPRFPPRSHARNVISRALGRERGARREGGRVIKKLNRARMVSPHVAGYIYYAGDYGIIGRLLVKLFRKFDVTDGRAFHLPFY